MRAVANSHLISLVVVSAMILFLICIRFIKHQLTYLELVDYIKGAILALFLSLYSLINIYILSSQNMLMSSTPRLIPLAS